MGELGEEQPIHPYNELERSLDHVLDIQAETRGPTQALEAFIDTISRRCHGDLEAIQENAGLGIGFAAHDMETTNLKRSFDQASATPLFDQPVHLLFAGGTTALYEISKQHPDYRDQSAPLRTLSDTFGLAAMVHYRHYFEGDKLLQQGDHLLKKAHPIANAFFIEGKTLENEEDRTTLRDLLVVTWKAAELLFIARTEPLARQDTAVLDDLLLPELKIEYCSLMQVKHPDKILMAQRRVHSLGQWYLHLADERKDAERQLSLMRKN